MVRVLNIIRRIDRSHYYSQETEVQVLRQRRRRRDDRGGHEKAVASPYTKMFTL